MKDWRCYKKYITVSISNSIVFFYCVRDRSVFFLVILCRYKYFQKNSENVGGGRVYHVPNFAYWEAIVWNMVGAKGSYLPRKCSGKSAKLGNFGFGRVVGTDIKILVFTTSKIINFFIKINIFYYQIITQRLCIKFIYQFF